VAQLTSPQVDGPVASSGVQRFSGSLPLSRRTRRGHLARPLPRVARSRGENCGAH